MNKIAILALATTLICSTALAQSAYDGIFKPKGSDFANWDCQSVGQDGGAIEIRGNEFFGVESYCKFSNPVNVNGMDATLFDAQCSGEGYQWNERVMLMKAESGIYYITDNFVSELQNCSAQ